MSRLTCYGVPSIFSFTSEVCGKCGGREGCRQVVYATLLTVADQPIVKHLLSVHQQHQVQEVQALPIDTTRPMPQAKRMVKRELTEGERKIVGLMPKKVGTLLSSIWMKSKDVAMRAAVARGENPFDPERARAYHTAYAGLSNGRVSRGSIVQSLMTEHGWSYSAAQSQATMVMHVLPALGFAVRDGDFLYKQPNN